MKNFIEKNKYWLYMLFVPIYLVAFFLTEKYINGSSNYWVSYIPFDDTIPFVDWFVIFYVLWYPLLVGVAILLLIKDKQAYLRYARMIVFGFSFSIVFFWIFPNGQNLRPETFANDNIFTKIIGLIYASDTNTNVLPSMHVYGSLCAMVAVIDSDRVDNVWAVVGISVLSVMICASTVFIKQHSILDVIAAVVMLIPLYIGVYWKRLFSRKEAIYNKATMLAVSEDTTENLVQTNTNTEN